jgi:2-methylisocitrate lyase-like PEP mutase family enzyme
LTTPPLLHPARHLQALLAGNAIVRAPGAYDALSARLVEAAGFEAVYMTGFGATASRIGQPDIGLLTQTEMTSQARDMVRATTLPVIADADTGYGGPSNIHRTVREYLQAGVAAIHLEDQVAPKRCGQMAGIRLIDAAENARHLKCAVAARGSDPLLIIGRTDALPAAGIGEALDRARRYLDTGIDLVFVDGVKTVAEVEAIAHGLPERNKIVSIVDGTPAVALSAADLHAMGFAVVLYAVTALFSATLAVQQALQRLAADGSPRAVPAIAYPDFTRLVGLPMHQALDDQYGAAG